MGVVQVSYYTDPLCPWSWALEPALRKLVQDHGQSLRFNYVMCGMARELGDPTNLVGESLEAAASSGMPVDPRLWLQGPPRSSFPACIAVKAAAEQGDPAVYLRRLREGLMCRRRKLDTTDALLQEARSVTGLELDRFQIDLGSHAILESFAADLERARGNERAPLPWLEFRGPATAAAEPATLHGFVGYEQLRAAALAAGAEPVSDPPPSIEAALARWGAMATAEVAAVCELPGPRAPAELWRLASEWRVQGERVGSGELWALA